MYSLDFCKMTLHINVKLDMKQKRCEEIMKMSVHRKILNRDVKQRRISNPKD